MHICKNVEKGEVIISIINGSRDSISKRIDLRFWFNALV